MGTSIHAATTMGAVSLTVRDLARSLEFYQHNLGFKLHHQEEKQAYLGAGGADLLILNENPAARPLQRGQTGLYHFAVLTPSRVALAQSLQRLAETQTPIQGFADHNVSEAIYLADPDGNGIEIYRDRPRSEWEYDNGKIKMATNPIDLDGILAELNGQSLSWIGLHPDTVIGHVHLHVSDIKSAEAFYCGVLGFDLMLRYGPSASFVSAGGYHHHLGLNTWAGAGAPSPPPDSIGLIWYAVVLPDQGALDETISRVKIAGAPIEAHEEGSLVRDPSQNGILLKI
jgi:catechol 2,3-dioxygenase